MDLVYGPKSTACSLLSALDVTICKLLAAEAAHAPKIPVAASGTGDEFGEDFKAEPAVPGLLLFRGCWQAAFQSFMLLMGC